MYKPSQWRTRVEVFILKEDKMVVGYKNDERRFQAPGGGVEKGQSLGDAAINECLEEIAVRIKNVKLISKIPVRVDWYELRDRGVQLTPKILDRMRKFRGSEIYFMKAEFDKVDKSLYNKDKDAMTPAVITKQKFISELKKDKEMSNWTTKTRIKMLEKL